MTETHDVIVVGGGVGGLHLAGKLKGLDVLVLERNRRVTLRDSGIVSTHFSEFFRNTGLVKDRIKHMELLSQKETINIRTSRPFAYILKREEFTKHLRKKAAKNAEIRYENVTGVEHSGGGVTVRTGMHEYRCKIVVGSDGFNSIVRRSVKIKDPQFCIGIMVIGSRPKEKGIKVFFNKHYSPDFFSWIIPQNREYGIISGIRPKEYLDFFRKKESLEDGRIYSYPIPVGSTRSFSTNTVLLGDACGQVKPLTGGGIMFSLRASAHAAHVIGKAFDENRFDERQLKKYESLWKRDFGCEIQKQMLFRRMYRLMTNREIDGMFTEFKAALENLDYFDYDRFSNAWVKMPKTRLIKAAIQNSAGLMHGF